MAVVDFPDDLIELERSAWEQIRACALTVDSAFAVQQAVTNFAAEVGQPRIDVENGTQEAHPPPRARRA
ncbi:hypothetical protein ACWCOW_37145 [Streptomyces sp. NPDC001939]